MASIKGPLLAAGATVAVIVALITIGGNRVSNDPPAPAAKDCGTDFRCLADKHSNDAHEACRKPIENKSRYDFKWDSTANMFLSRRQGENGTIIYIGDEVKFQNAAGAFLPTSSWCTYDPQQRKVLNVIVESGRLHRN